MLIKPILVCTYFYKDSSTSVVLELTESEEEDKSEKKTLEGCDEIFHSTSFDWIVVVESGVLKNSKSVETDMDEHIREIVPPPPQV
jgi:hypothetical protein